MAGFENTETVEQALDKGAPIGAIAEYFGLSRAEVVECARRRRIEKCARRRRIEKWEEAEIAKWRGAQACASEHTPPPWSEHEYALLQGLADIGIESAASRALGRSPDDIHKAMRELDRRARLREEEKIEKRIAAENRAALYQRMKEEAIEANWGELQVAREANWGEVQAARDLREYATPKIELNWGEINPDITINGKNYTALLNRARDIVRARIEIVAAIGRTK